MLAVMSQHLNLVTIGVDDLARARAFYVRGLGWEPAFENDEVDAVVELAATAGATVVKRPQRAAFGGYHGYFRDPDGVVWEVAHNPGFTVGDDGRVVIEAVAP